LNSGSQPSPIRATRRRTGSAQASAAQDIQAGGLFGDQDRLALRQDNDAGDELDLLRNGRHITEEQKWFMKWVLVGVRPIPASGTIRIGAHHMVVGQDVAKAQGFHRLGVVTNGMCIIAKFDLWKGNPDFHSLLPP
jgi:hypothetical protein